MQKKDSFLQVIEIFSLILSVLLFLLCVTTAFNWQTVTFLFISAFYIPFSLIFKRKYFAAYLIFVAIVLNYALPRTHILPFFFIIIVILIRPTWKNNLFIFYAINLFLECILVDEGFIKQYEIEGSGTLTLSIHITLICLFYYIIRYIIRNRFERKELVLTDDEKTILRELKEKKMLKCCESFSKNVLTQKLKDARERNKIDSNAELLAQFNLLEE